MLGKIIYLVFFGAMIFLGLSIILVYALPKINFELKEIITESRSIKHEQIGWFQFELSTKEIFSANNPIDVKIKTSAVPYNITTIQLSFEGTKLPTVPMPEIPKLPENVGPGSTEWDDYWAQMENFRQEMSEYFDKLSEEMASSVIHMKKKMTWFEAEKNNLVFRNGGDFDVGITITEDGNVYGYGLGDTSYILKNVIRVSPPESLIQLKQTFVTVGLAYAAIGASILAIGFSGIIEYLVKHHI